jgi:phosphinothricin acetyltransferase
VTRSDLLVRPAEPRDLPALREIYAHYVLTSPATFDLVPGSLEERREWFSHYAPTGRHRMLVAERDGTVVDYATSSRFRPRAAYDRSVETSVYVREDAVGTGVGTRLYEALFASLASEDVHRAYAGYTAPNPASQALHERFGFREVGRFTEVGWKFDRWWDVVWMEKRMDEGC